MQRSLYQETEYNQDFINTAGQLAFKYLLHCKVRHLSKKGKKKKLNYFFFEQAMQVDLDYETVLFCGDLKGVIIRLFVLLIDEWRQSQQNDAKVEFMKNTCTELIQKMSVVESRDLLTSCKLQLNEVLGLMATTDKNRARKLEIELELLIGKLH